MIACDCGRCRVGVDAETRTPHPEAAAGSPATSVRAAPESGSRETERGLPCPPEQRAVEDDGRRAVGARLPPRDAGLLHVRQQLSRRRVPRQLKTPAAQREVVLASALVTLLREPWLASSHKAPGDLVFCNA